MMMGTVPDETVWVTEDECKEILEWSRHYDNQLWFVTSLLTTANAVLMAIPSEKLRPEIGVFGMILTVVTVFFAASFRCIRERLHRRLKNSQYRYLDYMFKGSDKWWLRQWNWYVFFFALVAILWAWMLWANCPQHRCIWVSALVLSLLFLTLLYFHGRPDDSAALPK